MPASYRSNTMQPRHPNLVTLQTYRHDIYKSQRSPALFRLDVARPESEGLSTEDCCGMLAGWPENFGPFSDIITQNILLLTGTNTGRWPVTLQLNHHMQMTTWAGLDLPGV